MPWRVGPPDSDRITRVPSYSGYSPKFPVLQIRDFHSLWCDFPDTSPKPSFIMQVLQPRSASWPVWALPRSLAATSRISVDYSSCRYLDVSVPCVRSLVATLLTTESSILSDDGVTPFGNLRFKAYLTAPRSISLSNTRPSSPPTAKISTIYP